EHSRRLRRVLDRVMKGHSTRITVQPSRYSGFDPNQWWRTRTGVRTEIVELQRLVFEILLHPISFLVPDGAMLTRGRRAATPPPRRDAAINVGERWPSRLVATTAEDRRRAPT